MRYLRGFAEEYGLIKIIERIAEQPTVQGAILTLDDWWLTAWQYEEAGLGDEWARWVEWGMRHVPWPLTDSAPMRMPYWIPRGQPDLSWRPPYWDDLWYRIGRPEGGLPVRLIVCLRPPVGGERVAIPGLPDTSLPVSFEVRPVARLSTIQRSNVRPVVGGISVGPDTQSYGTLGGIVKDQTGRPYGMTCAHVFQTQSTAYQPAHYDDPQATDIGISLPSITLQPCPGNGPCNPYTKDPHIASVDTTLIEFNAGTASKLEILSMGPLAGVVKKSSMAPGQEITFEGRTSGHRVAEIGGLAVFYQLQLDGQPYCFEDLFEIRWRSYIRALCGPIVKPGDSGAWVCAETGQGVGWCGQIIGEDRHVGYATFAENTLNAWANVGKTLGVT